MDYYRIKTEFTDENQQDGSLYKRKSEDLVMAASYTEAEKIAYALIESLGRAELNENVTFEIIRTKIEEVLYNNVLATDKQLVCGLTNAHFEEDEDSGVGLYAVKVMLSEMDEKTGKIRKSNEVIYTPATSNKDAADYVTKYLKKVETRDFIIRDIKFDKAESILWPADVYVRKCEEADNL